MIKKTCVGALTCAVAALACVQLAQARSVAQFYKGKTINIVVGSDVGGGYDRAARFFDRLKVFKRAASLGGVESLCSLPVLTSQWGHSEEELERAGVTHSMARLSVGLEDADDLIADLDQALN